ncbi:MAG TPA: hypothetical protein VGJ49_04790 [Gaiellaceae bacterium]
MMEVERRGISFAAFGASSFHLHVTQALEVELLTAFAVLVTHFTDAWANFQS